MLFIVGGAILLFRGVRSTFYMKRLVVQVREWGKYLRYCVKVEKIIRLIGAFVYKNLSRGGGGFTLFTFSNCPIDASGTSGLIAS